MSIKKRISAIIATAVIGAMSVSANMPLSSMASSNYISDGWYYIKNINSQKYLDVSGKKDSNGSNVIQYKGNGGNNQKWYIRNIGNNVITIQSGLSSGRMLDVENGANTDGANVQLWEYNGATAQQFKVVQKDGAYCLLTKNSNETKAVDVYGWSQENNGNIDQWSYNGLACQQFKFEATSAGASTPKATTSSGSSNSSNSSNSSSSSSSSTGNTIEVKNGGTSLSDAIKKAKSGTTIVINGTVKSGAVKVPAGVNISGKNNATIDFSSTSGSNGRGLSFYGNGSTVENVTIKNASDNGIYIEGDLLL